MSRECRGPSFAPSLQLGSFGGFYGLFGNIKKASPGLAKGPGSYRGLDAQCKKAVDRSAGDFASCFLMSLENNFSSSDYENTPARAKDLQKSLFCRLYRKIIRVMFKQAILLFDT
jgi:hypothetical protein